MRVVVKEKIVQGILLALVGLLIMILSTFLFFSEAGSVISSLFAGASFLLGSVFLISGILIFVMTLKGKK